MRSLSNLTAIAVFLLAQTLIPITSLGAETVWRSGERIQRIRAAEAAAKRDYAANHYYFLTPRGLIDPAEGGIPPFALELRHWTVYRGSIYIKEQRFYHILNQPRLARRATIRRVGAMGVIGASTVVGGVSAADEGLSGAVRGVGVIGAFFSAYAGMALLERKQRSVGDLFLKVQRLNDKIRENLRAQYRLEAGVPITPPPDAVDP